MRTMRPLLIAFALMGGLTGAARAEPGFANPAPIEHVQEARYADSTTTPYAMNYADDAAGTLGMKNGRWQAFNPSPADPLVPSVAGGLDSGRPMLHLQWR